MPREDGNRGAGVRDLVAWRSRPMRQSWIAAITRAWRISSAVVLLVAFCVPTLLAGQRAELEKRIKRALLSNGLEVIVVENHGVPIVTIEVDVRNGSFTQGPAYEGLSHLYEHMFFKANRSYPRPDDFVARASQLGAVFNARTREEVVNYFITLPKDSIEGGMRFIASALTTPLFRADEIERERAVVIGEYDRNESSPGYEFQKAMDKALWTTAYSRKNTLGERDVILATTPERMRTIQHRYYVPNNTALIITGDVAPDRAFKLASDLLGDWKRGEDPFVADPIPPVPPLAKDTGVIVESPIGTIFAMMQWHGPGASKDPAATYAADVYSDVLNDPGSKFQQRLVDSGLFESLVVNYYTLNHVGPITVSGETTPEKLKRALAALDDELRRTVEPGYITNDELEATKQRRITDAMFQMERSSGFASQLGFWWAVTGLDYFFGYVDTMAKQTPDDLRRYVTTYIIGKPRVTGVLLPSEMRRALNLTTKDLVTRPIRP
jgi:zinc protease